MGKIIIVRKLRMILKIVSFDGRGRILETETKCIMRKELPVNLNIPYSGMVRDRNRLVAILTIPSNQTWYAENFIPLLLYPNGNIHCYDTTNFYEIFNIYDQIIEKKEITQINVNAVKQEIDNNRYVIALVDEFYLSVSVYYQLMHKYQEILVYGYDDCREFFLFHGSQIDKKDYGCGECAYADFEAAVLSSSKRISETESVAWRVLFGHPLSGFQIKTWDSALNICKIYYHFSNLLMGKTITVSRGQDTETFYAGMNIFDELSARFDQIRADDKQSHERAIWCIKLLAGYFSSYKNIFSLMNVQYGINFEAELDNTVDSISQKVLSIYSLLQKYVITKKSRNIDRAKETMTSVKEQVEMLWKIISTIIQDYLI